jgi:hypothetical protein
VYDARKYPINVANRIFRYATNSTATNKAFLFSSGLAWLGSKTHTPPIPPLQTKLFYFQVAWLSIFRIKRVYKTLHAFYKKFPE